MRNMEHHGSGQRIFAKRQDKCVIRAAMDLLRLEGPGSVNARCIAEYLDLHPQQVKELFPDNEALWKAILNRVRDRLMQLLEHEAMATRNPLQAITNIFDSHVSYIYRNPVVAHLLVYLLQTQNPDLRRQVQRIVQGYESDFSILISLARAKCLVRAEVDPQTAARLIITMIQGLIFRTLISEESDSIRNIARRVFTIYMNGIQAHTIGKRRSI